MTDPHTERFIRRARAAPKLSSSEELACIRAWRERGDRRARSRIAEANLRHVVYAALKLRNYGIALADLIGEGNVGLMKAIDRFDESKGVRFCTYAVYWIRAHVVLCVLDGYSLMSGPRGALDTRVFFRLRRERARLSAQHGPGELVARLAASFRVSPERMQEMLEQIDGRGVSLDAGSDDGGAPIELCCAPEQGTLLEQREARLQVKSAVERARPTLDRRETFILEHRLMADSDDELSLAELGVHFGISRERVRQLELRTCAKLRRAALPADGIAAPQAA